MFKQLKLVSHEKIMTCFQTDTVIKQIQSLLISSSYVSQEAQLASHNVYIFNILAVGSYKFTWEENTFFPKKKVRFFHYMSQEIHKNDSTTLPLGSPYSCK